MVKKKKERTFLRFMTQIYGDFRLWNFMARHESQVVSSHADF